MQPPDFSSTAPHLAWHARHTPSSTAVVEAALQVNYQTMASDLARSILALQDHGVASGMLVGVEIRRQRYLHLLVLLACEVIGATTTSFSQQHLHGDDPVLRHCNVLLLNEAPRADHPCATLTVPSDWLDSLPAMLPNQDHLGLLQRESTADIAVRITRTSGTTGRPKSIAVSRSMQQHGVSLYLGSAPIAIRNNAKFLCLYNFAVNAIYKRTLGVLQHGGTVLLAKEEQAHGLLGMGAVNYAVFTVGDMERIVQAALAPPVGHDLHIDLVGASASPRLRRLIRQRLNATIGTRYSSNETGMIAHTDDGNVGTILPDVAVRIVDAAGNDMPSGETGLIRVKTPTMTDGYFDDPALTAAAFVDGWYLTSDVGTMPAPNKLVVLGRADDMLNIGGIKLPALPVEDDIKAIPGINDAAVMSVDSPYQVSKLLVAVEIGDHPPVDLMATLTRILAPYVRTFEVMPLPSFPRTQTGKVRRQDIKAAFHHRQDHQAVGAE